MENKIQSLIERTESALEQRTSGVEGADQVVNALHDEIRTALRESPRSGEHLGPLIAQLKAALKARPDVERVHFEILLIMELHGAIVFFRGFEARARASTETRHKNRLRLGARAFGRKFAAADCAATKKKLISRLQP